MKKKIKLYLTIFFSASGTGTTQAGLIIGKLIYNNPTRIIGISIARKNPKGRNVVLDSIISYKKRNRNKDFIKNYRRRNYVY